ncbi:hypothetical protein [Robiginitomaculum antarcticum]|uniref:hypothetical protein n=1 Tax=Robiginitomaculum antarcticum TaxID=437507 RepID=UPI00037161D4|nr:hypothetical protein [Robiginitomaculum antarcticum]
MAKTSFEHKNQTYTLTGKWDGDVFTAVAKQDRKPASDPFKIERPKGDDAASDDVLENAAFSALKAAIEDGSALSSIDGA